MSRERETRRAKRCGWLVCALLPAACGARTALLTDQLAPCEVPGARRVCFNDCGRGTQVCADGQWQPCDATGERVCEHVCGTGRQQCADGEWRTCDAPTVRSCTTACGEGQQSCHDGIWSDCDARGERVCTTACGEGMQTCEHNEWTVCDATGTRSCENACGAGTQTCADGQWSACNALATRSCESDCGAGMQTCTDGVWSECDARAIRECQSSCGPGSQSCSHGTWGPCQGPDPGLPVLEATIRDFPDTHPDFERPSTQHSPGERGIVESELGPDDKPVYAGDPARGTVSTSGQPDFDQWYGRAPGDYLATTFEIELSQSPTRRGMFIYENSAFFPIDDQLLGNDHRFHNYHFTLELSTRFRYEGGEVFTFRGDDDLWVFINRHLALDLGGLHEEQEGTVELDAHAAAWGLQIGEVYPLHLFFAERHTVESHFTIETTIAEWHTCE